MNAIVPHIFEDQLVRSVMRDDEPWFVGRDVCHVLGLKNESQKLAELDDDEKAGYVIHTQFGAKETIIVCEAGVFRLIFSSRKPEAERFKRWLAHEVLPSIRKTGSYGIKDQPDWSASAPETVRQTENKLAMIREARMLWGHERARSLWRNLGLPEMHEPAVGGQGEAKECLSTILIAPCGGTTVREQLQAALDDNEEARMVLRPFGIWAEPEADGFVIANRGVELETIFAGTIWAKSNWQLTLRRLPGTSRSAPRKLAGQATRGVFLPARVLDVLAED